MTTAPFIALVRRASRFVRTFWYLVGISLVVVIGVDATLRLMFLIKDTWIDAPPRRPELVWAESLNGGDGETLALKYEQEFRAQVMDWSPYVSWRRKEFRGECINIDSSGLRRTWAELDTGSEERTRRPRVFVFGGSTIWGTGARDEHTIPSYVAKLLKGAGISAEVVNYGESGYVSTQEILALILRLQQGDIPDVVVFYDGANDTFSAYQNRRAGIPQNEDNRRLEFNLLNDPRRQRQLVLRQLPGMLAGLTRLAEATSKGVGLDSRTAEQPGEQEAPMSEIAKRVVTTYSANVQMVERLADEYGFTAFYFWQPVIFTKKAPTQFETVQAADSMHYKEFFLEVYQAIRSATPLTETARFQDLSAIFDNSVETCYTDFAHVTESANEKIATQVAQLIGPSLLSQITNGQAER